MLELFKENKISVTEEQKFFLRKGRKYCGRKRESWIPTFSPFPTFSKGFSLSMMKS